MPLSPADIRRFADSRDGTCEADNRSQIVACYYAYYHRAKVFLAKKGKNPIKHWEVLRDVKKFNYVAGQYYLQLRDLRTICSYNLGDAVDHTDEERAKQLMDRLFKIIP